MRVLAHFESIEKLKEAYYSMLRSGYEGSVVRLKAQMDEDYFTVTIHLGFEVKSMQVLPIVGEVTLGFGKPTIKEILEIIKNQFSSAYNVQGVVGRWNIAPKEIPE